MDLVNITAFGIKYKSYILIKDLKDLEMYYEKYRKPQISRACDSMRDYHIFSVLGDLGKNIGKIRTGYNQYPYGVLALADLAGQVFSNQLRNILDGKKLGINLKGGYFPLPDDAIIEKIHPKENTPFKAKTL